jgi:hypothetical protein
MTGMSHHCRLLLECVAHMELELQRELELERRKTATLQESVKEREKEYQKLKVGWRSRSYSIGLINHTLDTI